VKTPKSAGAFRPGEGRRPGEREHPPKHASFAAIVQERWKRDAARRSTPTEVHRPLGCNLGRRTIRGRDHGNVGTLSFGVLRMMASLTKWFREFRKYHHDDKGSGKIVKRDDHLMRCDAVSDHQQTSPHQHQTATAARTGAPSPPRCVAVRRGLGKIIKRGLPRCRKYLRARNVGRGEDNDDSGHLKRCGRDPKPKCLPSAGLVLEKLIMLRRWAPWHRNFGVITIEFVSAYRSGLKPTKRSWRKASWFSTSTPRTAGCYDRPVRSPLKQSKGARLERWRGFFTARHRGV
jgi:hypothetical protein